MSSFLHRLRSAVKRFRADSELSDWDLASTDGADLPEDLVHRITWAIPQDAIATGWRVDVETDEDDAETVEATKDEANQVDTALCIREALLEGHANARYDGLAYLWLVEEGREDQTEEVEPGAMISAIHVLRRTEVTPIDWEKDPESKRWSKPSEYTVHPARYGGAFQGGALRVHGSRLIELHGMPSVIVKRRTLDNLGPSAVDLYRVALFGYAVGWRAAAELLERRAMPVMRHRGHAGAQDARDTISSALETWWAGWNHPAKLGVVFGDDEISWVAPPISGSSETLAALATRISAVEGFSITRFFGTPPGGLSTDDAAGERNDRAALERIQETVYTPALQEIYRIVLGENDSRRIKWLPLSTPTEREQAETSNLAAQRDATLIAAGVIDPAEARGRHSGGEETLDLVLDAYFDPTAEEEDEGDMVAELVAQLEQPQQPPVMEPETEEDADGEAPPEVDEA